MGTVHVSWFAERTDSDGVTDEGSVHLPYGGTLMSAPDGGCGAPGCRCSPGHWIRKTFPRTSDGVVAGINARFDSRHDLESADWAEIEAMAYALRH